VAELTHDTTDDGFHEIHLSGKQLVFLFMATTVVCVAIFLCGVLVGRGVRAERGQDAIDSSAATAAAVAPAVPAPVADAGPPSAEPPAPAADDELSYHKRLEGDAPPAEDLKTPSEGAKQVPPAQAPPKSTPAAPPTATPAATTPAASDTPSSGGRPGTWVVQLVALRDRGAAGSIVQRLAAKGYPAFLVNPVAGSPAPVFKVQVGRYNDRHEAEQIARRLEKEEQFNPWISR
jgi:DedD protein